MILKDGVRGVTELLQNGDIKKTFKMPQFLHNNYIANQIFGDYLWITKYKEFGDDYFTTEYHDRSEMLYKCIDKINDKVGVAAEVLSAILDMYIEGYCHRDIHAKNIFVTENGIKITDFEYLTKLQEPKPVFLESYDIIGTGVESPCQSRNMCFTKNEPSSISMITGVSLDIALERLVENIKKELINVSSTFQAKDRIHKRNRGKIYGSIDLKYFKINDGQRNIKKRIEKFNIKKEDIFGKSILDLGCNTGAMLFELQRYNPGECIGIEIVKEQTEVSKKISAVEGFTNIKFITKDIESDICEPSDVVLCLSINKHVKNEDNLLKLLSIITKDTLYFEGNDGTNHKDIMEKLSRNGFKTVTFIGTCDDDIKESNNVRPMFIAKK